MPILLLGGSLLFREPWTLCESVNTHFIRGGRLQCSDTHFNRGLSLMQNAAEPLLCCNLCQYTCHNFDEGTSSKLKCAGLQPCSQVPACSSFLFWPFLALVSLLIRASLSLSSSSCSREPLMAITLDSANGRSQRGQVCSVICRASHRRF